jgi:hypothetical protein
MRRTLVPLLLALVTSFSSQAGAEGPSAQDRATARLLAEEADKKQEAGDLAGALELFQRADAIYPAPSLKVAIARVLVKQSKIIEAHELLLDVARSAPQKEEPAVWASAREAARQEAEALAPRVPRIEISLLGLDRDVVPTVLLDGKRIPNASIGVVRLINPGAHRVRAEAEGYLPAEQLIQMAEGEHYRLTLKMLREPTPVASAPVSAPKKSGSSIPSGSSLPPRPPPQEQGGGKGLMIVGFASGGAFLVAGSVLGLMVRSRVQDIKEDCVLSGGACPLSRRPDADAAERLALASNITFGLAAAGVGLGVYGWLTSGSSAAATSRGPSWRVGVGPGSVALGGQF